MLIKELKQALREVRDLCERMQSCAVCPLDGVDGCPTWDCEGDTVMYPSLWAVEWDETDKICPHCGRKLDEGAEDGQD